MLPCLGDICGVSFFYEDQCLLYLPSDLPDRGGLLQEQQLIAEILKNTQGRAFVLFTSYKGLNEVYDSLKDSSWRLLKQGDLPKNKLIKSLRRYFLCSVCHSILLEVDVPVKPSSCDFSETAFCCS